jgi:hypothetical protein
MPTLPSRPAVDNSDAEGSEEEVVAQIESDR